MDAGRELDALVAEKVMGMDSKIDYGYAVPTRVFARGLDLGIPGDWWGGAPEYSTDIAVAWQVVEKLRLWVIPTDSGWYAASEDDRSMFFVPEDDIVDGYLVNSAEAETAPLAICRAALAAVGALPVTA